VLSSPKAAADATLFDRLYHVHVTQHAFLQVWSGKTAEIPAANDLDVTSLGRWARTFYDAMTSQIGKFNEERLDGHIPESLSSKAESRLGPGMMSPVMGDTVLQVVTHSIYHRGQVSTRLRELECEPPLTEYFVWVWRGKPAAEWLTDEL
jgi:uncharacterized damage-inducible protein DinB